MSLLRACNPYADNKPLEVVPGFYRFHRPQSVDTLKQLHIKNVIDTESGSFEALHEDDYEKELPTAFDIKVTRIDSSGIWAPERHDVMTAMTVIRHNLQAKENTLLHCLKGLDRTGFYVAAFRILYQGWSYEQARDEYISMGLNFLFRFWLLELKNYKEIV